MMATATSHLRATLSSSSSTDELRQGAKQLSRGVEQYYLSTEVSLLVSVWFG